MSYALYCYSPCYTSYLLQINDYTTPFYSLPAVYCSSPATSVIYSKIKHYFTATLYRSVPTVYYWSPWNTSYLHQTIHYSTASIYWRETWPESPHCTGQGPEDRKTLVANVASEKNIFEWALLTNNNLYCVFENTVFYMFMIFFWNNMNVFYDNIDDLISSMCVPTVTMGR